MPPWRGERALDLRERRKQRASRERDKKTVMHGPWFCYLSPLRGLVLLSLATAAFTMNYASKEKMLGFTKRAVGLKTCGISFL